MITKEVYVEIEVLRKPAFSLRKIATGGSCAGNTVRSHLAQGRQSRYQRRKKRTSQLSAHETYLRDRQAAAQPQEIPTTVLFREMSALGNIGGASQCAPSCAQYQIALPTPVQHPLTVYAPRLRPRQVAAERTP